MGTLRFFEEVVSFKIRRTFGFADYTDDNTRIILYVPLKVPLYPYLSLLDNRKTPAEIGSCILHRERIEIMLERLPITPHLITIDKPMMETYSHRHRTASLHIDHYLSEYRQRDILACILRKLEL